jgi:phage shock protein C
MLGGECVKVNQITTRKLYRARRGRWIAGVAEGMANWSGVPVVLVRLFWLLLLLPGGLPGILPYLLCWILIPKEPSSFPYDY